MDVIQQIMMIIVGLYTALVGWIQGLFSPTQQIEWTFEPQPIIWEGCSKEDYQSWFSSDIDPRLECGRLALPLDYSTSGSLMIQLPLTRLPALGTSSGTLLIISGGPGDHSLDLLQGFANNEILTALYESFDIVGYAPRGVAPSMPHILCEHSTSLHTFVASCIRNTGAEVLRFLSTKYAVYDIESIRLALGGQPLNVLAYSYGTKVLAYYAQWFPHGLRAGILDGIVDTTEDLFAMLAGQERGFQQTFDLFVEYCLDLDFCIFEQTGQPAYDKYQALLDKIGYDWLWYEPYDAWISRDDVSATVYEMLMWDDFWEELAQMLYELEHDELDTYARWNYDGNDSSALYADDGEIVYDNYYGLEVISCADSAPVFTQGCRGGVCYQRDKTKYSDRMRQVDAESLYDGVDEGDNLDACFYRPFVGTDDLSQPSRSKGSSPLLFVAQRYDPATPYANAVRMAKFFDSPLITREGRGHTLVFTATSSCIDQVVLDYLRDPNAPIESQTCD